MLESATELAELQALIDRSIEGAGSFIRGSLQMPEKSLSAAQLVKYWTGFRTAAVAHSTKTGEPRVAPTGVALLRGRLVVPTVMQAARTRALRARPGLSISLFDEGDLAIIAHGRGVVLRQADPEFGSIAASHREANEGRDVTHWEGTGVYIALVPDVLYTFARYPEKFSAAGHGV